MAGKREKRRIWCGVRRVLGVAVLTVFAFLLTSGAPVGQSGSSEAVPLEKKRVTPPIPVVEETQVVPKSVLVDDRYFDDVVFVGDSRTQGLQLYSGLKNGRFLCAVGATAESVFSKETETTEWGGKVPILDALASMDCGKVYIMLGINELGWPNSDTFRQQYSKMIDRIRQDHPDIVVVIESLLPVSALQEAKGSYVNNERIVQYNEILMELAEEKDCPYLNVAEAVQDENGCLQAAWNFDGVHLNPAGCTAWRTYLETHPVEPYDPSVVYGAEPDVPDDTGEDVGWTDDAAEPEGSEDAAVWED